MISRLIGRVGIVTIVIAGIFALLGYMKISYVFLAMATIDLLVAVMYHPNEFKDAKDSKKAKIISYLSIVSGVIFIYATGNRIGLLLVSGGIHDLLFGENSIFKKTKDLKRYPNQKR
ncbi:hypothetical protein [Corynebacterium diphtheriae]|uniref:hypothetical protein n=1 Tax=Corynebacterium diphtheriae TaxID=1717 RepID=UPI003531FEFF